MEIAFPIEFIVHGTPVSQQAKRAASKAEWQSRVREASRIALPDAHFASNERLAVTMFYLPDGAMQGDLDNIIKPILDALSKHIYIDDVQVERIVAHKFEPDKVFTFRQPTDTLRSALTGRKPALYLRVSNDPTGDLE